MRKQRGEGRATGEKGGRLLRGNAVSVNDRLQERFDELCGPVEVRKIEIDSDDSDDK